MIKLDMAAVEARENASRLGMQEPTFGGKLKNCVTDYKRMRVDIPFEMHLYKIDGKEDYNHFLELYRKYRPGVKINETCMPSKSPAWYGFWDNKDTGYTEIVKLTTAIAYAWQNLQGAQMGFDKLREINEEMQSKENNGQ